MVTKFNNLKIFTANSHPELANSIANHLGVPLGRSEVNTFSDGEINVSIFETVRGSDVFIVQSTCGPVNNNLMELLIMTDAFKRASAGRITAVIPYFGYARQDRKSKPRDPITAKLVANLLTVAGVDRIITIDLHQGQIQGFFDTPLNHLTALPLFDEYFRGKGLSSLPNVCVVTPDVGRAKAAKKLADMMDADLAIMSKTRTDHNQSEVTSVIGDVTGKICIINDDMIDTGGSVVNGAIALKEAGAGDIYICATHGLFSGQAIERLETSEHIKEVVVCDTVAVPEQFLRGKIKTVSVAGILANAVLNVFTDASISDLFDPDFQI